MLNLMQLAKGFHFTSILARTNNPDWRSDPSLLDLLNKIDGLKILLNRTEEIEENSLLTEEILLNAYVSEIERTSGNNDEKRLFNFQKQFDELLHKKLTGNNPALLTAPGLQALIPEKPSCSIIFGGDDIRRHGIIYHFIYLFG